MNESFELSKELFELTGWRKNGRGIIPTYPTDFLLKKLEESSVFHLVYTGTGWIAYVTFDEREADDKAEKVLKRLCIKLIKEGVIKTQKSEVRR